MIASSVILEKKFAYFLFVYFVMFGFFEKNLCITEEKNIGKLDSVWMSTDQNKFLRTQDI